MKTTLAIAQKTKVETLAKLYLKGDPVEISDATLAELCDWLWGEFQSTPLNLEFSCCEHYNNAAEMFTDIKRSHLWVSAENYDTTMGLNPIYNFIFQRMHDNNHYLTQSDFSLEGEIATYNATAKRAPSLDIQKIVYMGWPSSGGVMGGDGMMNKSGELTCAACHGSQGRGGVYTLMGMRPVEAPDIHWSALQDEFNSEFCA